MTSASDRPVASAPFRPHRPAAPAAFRLSSSPARALPAVALAGVLLAAVLALPAVARAQEAQENTPGQAAAGTMEKGRGSGAQPMTQQEAKPEQASGETASAAAEEDTAPPAIDTAAAVLAADRALAKAVSDGKPDDFAALIADDAVFLSAQGTLHGRDAIVAGWASLMAKDRTATLTWEPQGARLAASRDLAYTAGQYTLTVQRAEGDPLKSQGQYISVWTRDVQAGGPWEIILDGPLRRGRAAYLERTFGERGQIGPKTGSAFTFVPDKVITAQSDDLSITLGTYQAQRVDLDGTEHPIGDGSWFSVWATKPEATPDEATRLLPAGDSVTPPPPMAAEKPAAGDDEQMDGE